MKIRKTLEKQFAAHKAPISLEKLDIKLPNYMRLYKIHLHTGTKCSTVQSCVYDIKMAMHLSMLDVMIENGEMYLIISTASIRENSLPKILVDPQFNECNMKLPIAVGYNMIGIPVVKDLAEMHHAMYAGGSGSGKSEGLISAATCLLYRNPVSKVNMVIIDIGSDTLDPFDGVPHLCCPIVKDIRTAAHVINCISDEMERRRNLPKDEVDDSPYIVCFVDEYLVLVNDSEEFKGIINSLSDVMQRGRHSKIILIISTQNARKDAVKTDLVNVQDRMVFACGNGYDSRVFLGDSGAERLIGNGDMLFRAHDAVNPVHLQGTYISSDDLNCVLNFIKSNKYDLSNKFVIPEMEAQEPVTSETNDNKPSTEEMRETEMAKIIMWTLAQKTVSANRIIESFSMGKRAQEIVDELTHMGIVSEQVAKLPRKVLVNSADELSPDAMILLLKNGFSIKDVSEAIAGREQ